MPVPTEEMAVVIADLKGRFQGDPSYEYENPNEKKEDVAKTYEEEAAVNKL